ncbi:MAG: hypothetical protein WA138_15240 [Parvibaculum sp.]
MSEHEHHPAISRRNVLMLGGVAIVAGALPASFHLFEPDNGALADTLVSLLADRQSAARLGTLWAKNSSAPREPEAIAAKIGERLRSFGWSRNGTPDELREALAGRIAHDFAHNDMVSLSGWQLARTSAELCALAASMTDETPEATPAKHE